ncbi:hypothetical protein QUC31_001975 [Theobroma cacao]|nr:hypothetical protein QQP08_021445 [Theobroma cacao]
MKKISKKRSNGFCMCFHPDDMERGFAVGPGEEQSERVNPFLSPAVHMCSDDVDKDFTVGSFGRKCKLGRRSFSRYVKAVFFETSLMMKMRNKKFGEKLQRSHNSVKSKPKKVSHPKSMEKSCEDNPSTRSSTFASCLCTTSTTNSSSSSSLLSSLASSKCSSSSSLSLPEKLENNMQGNVGKGCYGYNVSMCLLLVTLFVLVFWGKLCAIFCTSTWLFLATCWSIKLSPSSSGNYAVEHFPEIDTDKFYKKKVIMEGLLERNHSSIPQPLLKQ